MSRKIWLRLNPWFSTAGPRRFFAGPQNNLSFFDLPSKYLKMFSVYAEVGKIEDNGMWFVTE